MREQPWYTQGIRWWVMWDANGPAGILGADSQALAEQEAAELGDHGPIPNLEGPYTMREANAVSRAAATPADARRLEPRIFGDEDDVEIDLLDADAGEE